MKILSVSDTHLGISTFGMENVETGLSTRTEDIVRALDRAADYAINNNVKLVIHSGDVFDSKTVSQTVVESFYKWSLKLSKAGIDLFILQGNHDSSVRLEKRNGLDIAKTLELNNIHTTRGDELLDLDYIQIASVNYWDTPEETAAKIEEHTSNIDWKRPAVLVMHAQIDYPDFPGSFKADLPFIPIAALTAHPWLFIQVGHIHKAQILSENPFAFYVGSLVRCTFSEERQDKGFWVSEIKNNKLASIKHIVDDKCLKMQTIRGNMTSIKEMFDGKTGNFENYIIKFIIDDSEEVVDEVFIREHFGTAFKYIITTEAKERIRTVKVEVADNISMESYLDSYFKQDNDKEDLFKLVQELKILDENKAVER
jgi:exonuclease SbcD